MGRSRQFIHKPVDNAHYDGDMRDMPADQLDRLIVALSTKGWSTNKLAHRLGMFPADVDAVISRAPGRCPGPEGLPLGEIAFGGNNGCHHDRR
jgi:hypothetical protein